MIALGKLLVATKTSGAIKDLQYITTVSGLQFFFGLCNVYQRFTLNIAKPAAQLNKKLKEEKHLKFCFEEEDMKAVNAPKEKLITAPVLARPKSNGQFTFDTDA